MAEHLPPHQFETETFGIESIALGEYQAFSGTEPLIYNPGQLRIGEKPDETWPPGITHVGVYAETDESGQTTEWPVVAFGYDNPNSHPGTPANPQRRVVIVPGIGGGEHEGHRGQGRSRYIIGPQINATGESLPFTVTQELSPKHFAVDCVV
jgi:hypothetical protein